MNLPNGDPRTFYLCTRCCAPTSPTNQTLLRCGGCQLAAYCSKDCQSNDRKAHKPLCKMFPVVNGINVLHTRGSWEQHLAGLLERASRLPSSGTGPADDYVETNQIFQDPKVCYTCRETRPDRLTMCKCSCVCYCSKKCTQADRKHKHFCNLLNSSKEETCQRFMKTSYPMTLWYVLELLSNECRPTRKYLSTNDIVKLKVHVVTNTTYFDTQAWEVIFHQSKTLNLNQLELVFIIQDGELNPSLERKEKFTHLECGFCDPKNRTNHVITSSVHRKPYHMFFSSSEYSEPDAVIVYGFTGKNSDIHSDISYRNMTYSHNSVLILTDSTLDLVNQGALDVKAARPVDMLVPPILNRGRVFGSHRNELDYDAAAINDKYYLTCLRRK